MLIYTKVLQLTGICFLENGKKDGQSLENYIKQLTTMCNSCNFDKDNTIKDNLLRDMIISGIIDKRLQEKTIET